MINKSDSRCAVVRFCYHSYDYRPNWTPLSPITITYWPLSRQQNYRRIAILIKIRFKAKFYVSLSLTPLSSTVSKMAEASRNQLPSGYDEDFVNAVEEDYQCPICQLTLREPILTKCGHRFCKECLEEHFRRCGFSSSITLPLSTQMFFYKTFRFKSNKLTIISFLIEFCYNYVNKIK